MFNRTQITAALADATIHLPDDWQGGNIQFDTRKLQRGEIFVALSGVRDGHDFVFDAIAKGAAAVIIDKHLPEFDSLPRIMVDDCLSALNKLAKYKRQTFTGPVIGITGAMGKTSCKEMLSQLLSNFAPCHYSHGSFNNHIGLPLTLSNRPESAKLLVLEMGMNHPGEIAHLTGLGQPEIAIITTVGPVHLEFMGTTEAVARAKAEIFQGLVGQKLALLPIDNEYYPLLDQEAKKHGAKIITFGTAEAADFRLIGSEQQQITANLQGATITFNSQLSQPHLQLYQVLALGVCTLLGYDLNQAAAHISKFTAATGRGATQQVNIAGKSITLIDETYNASPQAMIAALKNLKNTSGQRKIAIIGDMVELGTETVKWHQSIAEHCDGIDLVITGGELMKHVASLLDSKQHVQHIDSYEQFDSQHFSDLVAEGDVVMVKASHALKFDKILGNILTLNNLQPVS